MSLHWPVDPYSLSAISNFLCILLPHWPGILTCLRVWGTWYFGEPQISLLGTCCCSSSVCSNFLFFFCLPFHYLLSREICVLSLSLLLSSPCSPPFSEGVGWLFFSRTSGLELLIPCLHYARVAGMYHLTWLHPSFCWRHSISERKSLSSEALGFWDTSPDHLVLR